MHYSSIATRRNFCLGAGVSALLLAAPDPLHATQRERDDDNFGFKPRYSVDQYLKLSRKQIHGIRGIRRGRDIRIDGFSISMTDYILEMSSNDYHGTRRLIRDMRKLTDPKARKARLQREITKAKELVKTLKDSIRRLSENKGSFLAISQERNRLFHAEGYLGGVETWLEFPHEGTRE